MCSGVGDHGWMGCDDFSVANAFSDLPAVAQDRISSELMQRIVSVGPKRGKCCLWDYDVKIRRNWNMHIY